MSCPKHQAQEREEQEAKNSEAQQYGPDNPPPGSTFASKSQTMSVRELRYRSASENKAAGREFAPSHAAYPEVAGWESANELEDESPAKRPAGCIEGHDPEVYCSGCRPACTPEPRDAHGQTIPKEWVEHAQRLALGDQVGTFDIGGDKFDIGKSWGNMRRIDETCDRLLETEELRQNLQDKGPGFEARLKNMEGKAPMSLLSPIFIEGICAVLAYGSEKYAPNMWRDDPMTFTAELDSIFRHLFAFLRCEDYDAAPPSGSGLLHLFNAGCRLMFLTERYFTHPELDDRYPAPGLEDEMFQEEVEVGAEAQYEDDDLHDIIDQLSSRIWELENKNV